MPSEWTVDSLKEHFEAIIDANDRRYEQRFKDQEAAVKAALASAEKAVEREQDNSEKWRENANEWRGAMNDRERNLMPRTEAEQSMKSVTEKVDALASRSERSEGKNTGFTDGWKYLIAGIGLIATIVGLVNLLWKG